MERSLVVFTDADKERLQGVFHEWDVVLMGGRMQWPGKFWDVIVIGIEPRTAPQFAFVKTMESRLKPDGKLIFLET